MIDPLHERLRRATVIELSHVMQAGMPQYGTQSPFQLLLARRHGDTTRSDGTSSASELLSFGGHSGTHIDALGHFSAAGKLHGGHDAFSNQGPNGLKCAGVDELAPQLCRGILLDVARLHATAHLPPAYEVTVNDLVKAQDAANVTIRPGDAVLLHTGWSTHWHDPQTYVSQAEGTPGPGAAAAQWLIDSGANLVGGDTITFEVRGPGHDTFVVHRMLLVEAGIPIVECMNLAELAALGVAEFTLVLLPLRIAGGTASPVRPVALLDGVRDATSKTP
jgi:kynurenine formamidase